MFELEDYIPNYEKYNLEKIGLTKTEITYKTKFKLEKILQLYREPQIKKLVVNILNNLNYEEIPQDNENIKSFFDNKITEEIKIQHERQSLLQKNHVDTLKRNNDTLPLSAINSIEHIKQKNSIEAKRARLYRKLQINGFKKFEKTDYEYLKILENKFLRYDDLFKKLGRRMPYLKIPRLKDFSLDELEDEIKNLTEFYEKKSVNRKKRKPKLKSNYQNLLFDYYIISLKNFVDDISIIKNSDLEKLFNLKKSLIRNGIKKIKDLDNAKLHDANIKLKESGYPTENSLHDANNMLLCINSRKKLMEVYPNEDWKNKPCNEVIYAYKEYQDSITFRGLPIDIKEGQGKIWHDWWESRKDSVNKESGWNVK